jgi:hypothetical protein
MEIQENKTCWSCNHSDFNPTNGKLICSFKEDIKESKRPELCPLDIRKQEKVINIESHPKLIRFGDWHKQVSNA